jgi:hypothetical protein
MSEQVITGNVIEFEKRSDGIVYAQIAIDSEYSVKAEEILSGKRIPVVVARLNNEDVKKKSGPYGQYARALVQSGFFRSPVLWNAVGTDGQYLTWLKKQRCAFTGEYGHEDNPIVAAHVRRVSNGSGMGIKPPFSAIPLNNFHHQQQHLHGEDSINDSRWWNSQRIKYVERWAIERFRALIKDQFNVESLTWLSPDLMSRLAHANDFYHIVPAVYKART